jgi:hypothetical protein
MPAFVPVEPIREAIEEEISRSQEHVRTTFRPGSGQPVLTPLDSVTEEVTRYTGRAKDGVQRALYRIRSGFDHSKPVRFVTLRLADEILCAIDRPDLWHTDERLKGGEMQAEADSRTRGMVARALCALCALVGCEEPTEYELYWLDRFTPEEIRAIGAYLA